MKKIRQIGNLSVEGDFVNPFGDRVFATNGVAPTLVVIGGCRIHILCPQPFVMACAIRSRQGKLALELGGVTANSLTMDSNDSMALIINTEHILDRNTMRHKPLHECSDEELATLARRGRIRIRRLTPKECFRLMGMDEADIEKIQQVPTNPIYADLPHLAKPPSKKTIPKTHQYRLAGNSIAIDPLYHCLKVLFYPSPPQPKQLEMF